MVEAGLNKIEITVTSVLAYGMQKVQRIIIEILFSRKCS